MKRFVYKEVNGNILIVMPGLPEHKIPIDPTEKRAYLDRVKQTMEDKNPELKAAEFMGEVEHTELPASREFRNQWRHLDGQVKPDPILETEERWKRIRIERNKRLDDSDKKLLRVQDQGGNVNVWKVYRQALRDVTIQSDPKNIVWPESPES